jgi:hypothetical protein
MRETEHAYKILDLKCEGKVCDAKLLRGDNTRNAILTLKITPLCFEPIRLTVAFLVYEVYYVKEM